MSETLTDKCAELQVDGSENSEVQKIISELKVQNAVIRYTTLRSEGWNRLCSLRTLARRSADYVVRKKSSGMHVSDDVKEQLQGLKQELAYAWDEEAEKFRVECKYGEDGNISELFIPLETDISSDFTVQKLYDEDGNFQAESIKSELGEEMYKIETKELRVNRTSNNSMTIYEKTEKDFKQRYEEALANQNSGAWKKSRPSTKKTIKEFGFAMGLAVILYGTLGAIYMFSFGAFAVALVAMSFAYFLPFILPIIVFVLGSSMLQAATKAKLNEGEKDYRKLFKANPP